jgi:hypothetical protein
MFLLFGLVMRRKMVNQGEFDCPNEGAPRLYYHERSRRWFTLFFIPVVPLGRGREWVHCSSCGTMYDLDVLRDRVRHPFLRRL